MPTGTFLSRLKSIAGYQTPPTLTLTGTIDLILPSSSDSFYLTAAAGVTVSTINAGTSLVDKPAIMPGRIVHLEALPTSASTITFTDQGATQTRGYMDLGGISADFVMSATDVLCLKQREDGSWVEQYETDN